MIASDNLFPKLIYVEGAAAGTPATGTVVVYAKSDGLLYSKDDAGVETALGVVGSFSYSVQTVTSAATVTPVTTNDKVVIIAQAAALTIANPSGTASEGQGFVIALKDDGTARTITWGANYRAMGAALPTTTTISKWTYIPVIYNATDDKWDVLAVSQQA